MTPTSPSHRPLSLNQDQQLLREWIVLTRSERRPFVLDWMGLEFGARPDIGRLERALTTIVQRHEVLRTEFTEPSSIDVSRRAEIFRRRSELPLSASLFEQRVHTAAPVTVSEGALDGVRRDWQSGALDHDALRAEIAKGFRYDRPPLVRATLFRCDDDCHLLSLVVPHLVTDGWGMRVLRQELAALYGPSAAGGATPLPPLEFQFSDFAMWEREQLATAWSDAKAYWRARAAEFMPTLVALPEIPYWRPADAGATGAAQRAAVAIDAAFTKQLRAFCRTHGVTMHIAWLAATALTLHLYSGRDRVAVMGYAANRTQPRWQPLIGSFANGFVCGLSVRATTGEALLREARRTALGVLQHQMVPMSVTWRALIEDGLIPKDFYLPAGLSLDYTTVPREPNVGEPWRRPVWRYITGTLRDPGLPIRVTDEGPALTLVCAYPAAHFSAAGAHQVLHDIHRVMRMMVRAPHEPVETYRHVLGTEPVPTHATQTPRELAL